MQKKNLPAKVEKTTSKSCILMAVGSFFLCSPNCPKQPRTSFLFYELFYPIVSAKVSAPMSSFHSANMNNLYDHFTLANPPNTFLPTVQQPKDLSYQQQWKIIVWLSYIIGRQSQVVAHHAKLLKNENIYRISSYSFLP